MARHVLLNNVDHKDLRVVNRFSPELGDGVNCVLTFPTEYLDVQRDYPILFKKNQESGRFQSVALLGFAKNENLFLEEGGWSAGYIPGMIARGPFLIGFQEREVDGESKKEPVLHVDLNHPKVSFTEGEPVFLPHGGNTPYLERMASVLRGINQGLAASGPMFQALASFDLVEPVNIVVKVNEVEQYDLNSFYSINENRLLNLPGAALEQLNKAGFLQAAFLVIASLNNISRLIDRKNRKRVADLNEPLNCQ